VGVTGCIALGVIVGLISGLIAGIAFESSRRRLNSTSAAFPLSETSALTGLLAFITGGSWAGSKWIAIAEPPCSDLYLAAVCVLLIGGGYASYRRLLIDSARADARTSAP
jgi:hypothetical protein